MRISVLGTGYLGATHAAGMARLGHSVIGVDTDAAKITTLSSGRAPFHEPGLDDLLVEGIASGRLTFSTRIADAADADVHFVCVGTPQRAGSHAADLSAVDAVVTALAEHLRRPTLIAGKSTVPVGTAARLTELVQRLAPVATAARVAWNPEFLREGLAVQDTLQPDRLVFGVAEAADEATLRQVYAPIIDGGVPVVVADLATAELVKVSANAFLATKISFINAMAEVCEAAGADVTVLAEALSHDARIGGLFLRPGLGFGGGCLPKDLRAFMARAGEIGAPEALTFLREVDSINHRRRQRMIDLAAETLGGSVRGATIGVLGAAFKPDSDDVRDSPALDVATRLQALGAAVTVHDPVANDNARQVSPHLTYSGTLEGATAGADLLLLLTEWRQFRDLDPVLLRDVVAVPRILDGRNVLDAEAWRSAGWTYRALGRPH
jgi:UDPglucose 6-dehydrogenase